MTNDEKKANAFQLATKFQISAGWLALSAKENSISLQKYMGRNENCSVFNEAVAIAYAYMCLVIPKESHLFENINSDDNDKMKGLLEGFDYVEYTYKDKKNLHSIIRHIRNALSHGSIECDGGGITFYDEDTRNNLHAEFKTTIVNFGNLVDEIYFIQKQRHFEISK